MACSANHQRRPTGELRFFDVFMALCALHLQLTGVQFMIEPDGLENHFVLSNDDFRQKQTRHQEEKNQQDKFH